MSILCSSSVSAQLNNSLGKRTENAWKWYFRRINQLVSVFLSFFSFFKLIPSRRFLAAASVRSHLRSPGRWQQRTSSLPVTGSFLSGTALTTDWKNWFYWSWLRGEPAVDRDEQYLFGESWQVFVWELKYLNFLPPSWYNVLPSRQE